MKPKNFPERARQRRIRAALRLREMPDRDGVSDELDVLALRVAGGNERDVRTKKDRSDRAAFRRA